MRDYLAITKALSDEMRVRALAALAGGELCLCQIIDLLGLAPSTVSRHMTLLHAAGLVLRRKDGRWHYYRLPGREAAPVVRQALRWTLAHVKQEKVMSDDAQRLCRLRAHDRKELTTCYSQR